MQSLPMYWVISIETGSAIIAHVEPLAPQKCLCSYYASMMTIREKDAIAPMMPTTLRSEIGLPAALPAAAEPEDVAEAAEPLADPVEEPVEPAALPLSPLEDPPFELPVGDAVA
jgi:hypothetical protein